MTMIRAMATKDKQKTFYAVMECGRKISHFTQVVVPSGFKLSVLKKCVKIVDQDKLKRVGWKDFKSFIVLMVLMVYWFYNFTMDNNKGF